MKYTAKYFRDNLPDWKRKKDPILTKIFYRPVSFYLSAFFSNIGWTANMVSYLSALVAIAGCICFVAVHPIIGSILINLWGLLDSTDGNIARSVKHERFGDFADSMSSYICVGLMFMCMGFCVYETGGLLVASGNPYIILVGALAGSSDSLMRLLYHKYLSSAHEQGIEAKREDDPAQASGINRIRMKVDQYVSVGGFLPAIMLVCSIVNWLDLVVIAWCVYYVLTFVASILYFVRKTFKANAADRQDEGA